MGRCVALSVFGAALGAVGLAAQPRPELPPIAPPQAHLSQTIADAAGPVTAIAFEERTGVLVAASEQGSLAWWGADVVYGVRVGDHTPNVIRAHEGPVVALAAAGSILASAGFDQKVCLWALPNVDLLRALTPTSAPRALSLTRDGQLLAVAGEDGHIQLWDVLAGQLRRTLAGHGDWVLCLAFSPDGKTLASGGQDHMVRLWDVATGKKLHEAALPPTPANTPPGLGPIVGAVAFSADGKMLALGSGDGQVHLANPIGGKVVRSFPGHESAVTALAFHPSGTVLVSASQDRTLRLWNPANGQALKVLEGHTAWVQGVTFLANGTRLASAGADQTVRFWDLR
jgi:WD40 repeat protein